MTVTVPARSPWQCHGLTLARPGGSEHRCADTFCSENAGKAAAKDVLCQCPGRTCSESDPRGRAATRAVRDAGRLPARDW